MDARPTADEAVQDVPARARYELVLDGVLAGFLEYAPHRDRLVLTHTEVNPDIGGQGLGGRLVRAVLDDIRGRGGVIEPRCPFVAAWIGKHPEYADLVHVAPADPLVEGLRRN
jgi:predicted GNAT family acetyltransferase